MHPCATGAVTAQVAQTQSEGVCQSKVSELDSHSGIVGPGPVATQLAFASHGGTPVVSQFVDGTNTSPGHSAPC
jgi:hypothetical protein